MQVFLCITNNSSKHYLSDQTVLFQTILCSISHLFALSLDVKQFYLTHTYDPIRCNNSRPEWIWEQWQWRDTSYFLNLQHYWSLTIRLCNDISKTLIGGVYSSTEIANYPCVCIYSYIYSLWDSARPINFVE